MNKTCINCNAIKPTWSTHRLCPKCRRANVPNVTIVQPTQVLNDAGQPVKIKASSKVIRIAKAYTRRSRKFMAYCTMWRDGRKNLTKFSETIVICGGWYHHWDAETVAQTLSAESIHMAMYRLGMGTENIQFDQMKLHSWKERKTSLEEYDGIAIKQYGLREQD